MCRQPHKGIVPIYGNADASDDSPDVVSVPEMRVFVFQYIRELFPVKRMRPVDIDRRGKDSDQAGRVQTVSLIDRKLVLVASDQIPVMPQPFSKPQGAP